MCGWHMHVHPTLVRSRRLHKCGRPRLPHARDSPPWFNVGGVDSYEPVSSCSSIRVLAAGSVLSAGPKLASRPKGYCRLRTASRSTVSCYDYDGQHILYVHYVEFFISPLIRLKNAVSLIASTICLFGGVYIRENIVAVIAFMLFSSGQLGLTTYQARTWITLAAKVASDVEFKRRLSSFLKRIDIFLVIQTIILAILISICCLGVYIAQDMPTQLSTLSLSLESLRLTVILQFCIASV